MNTIEVSIGFILAVAVMAVALWFFYRYIQTHFIQMMIREIPSPLGYAETLEKLESNISSKPDWHIFNVVDQGKEIVDNGGESIGRMTILQFCHGPLASRMFSNEGRRRMSVFSPRSISVYEKADGKAYVAIMNGDLMMKFTDPGTRAVIQNVAKDVKSMLAFLHS